MAPCGDPLCPVPDPTTTEYAAFNLVEPERYDWWRGHKHAYDGRALVPAAVGNTRFAPIAGVHHAYIGATRTVSLVESAFHSVVAPADMLYLHHLAQYTLTPVKLALAAPRLLDIRDAELARLGLARSALVTTMPEHYGCTRARAARARAELACDGIIWHSRQAKLHAAANLGGLFADVLHHNAAEVAVIWSESQQGALTTTGQSKDLVDSHGNPFRLVGELVAALSLVLES